MTSPTSNLNKLSFVRRLSMIGTRLSTRLRGREVGRDIWGNRYYIDKRETDQRTQRRWVIFAADPACCTIPPLWKMWLCRITDSLPQTPFTATPTNAPRAKDEENCSKSPKESCLQGEHMVRGKGRGREPRDYLPWRPPQRSSGGSFGRY